MTSLKPFKISDTTLEVGTDESGTGSAFGRLYAGAVFWDPSIADPIICDSKKLKTRQKRLEAYDFVKEHCLSYGFGYAEASEIDTYGQSHAIQKAMHQAIRNCHIVPEHILVDGINFKIFCDPDGNAVNFDKVVNGDGTYMSIAAASIVAKAERDLWIERMCDEYPKLDLYDLRSNKGYTGAKKHIQGIQDWGITQFHRKSVRTCHGKKTFIV